MIQNKCIAFSALILIIFGSGLEVIAQESSIVIGDKYYSATSKWEFGHNDPFAWIGIQMARDGSDGLLVLSKSTPLSINNSILVYLTNGTSRRYSQIMSRDHVNSTSYAIFIVPSSEIEHLAQSDISAIRYTLVGGYKNQDFIAENIYQPTLYERFNDVKLKARYETAKSIAYLFEKEAACSPQVNVRPDGRKVLSYAFSDPVARTLEFEIALAMLEMEGDVFLASMQRILTRSAKTIQITHLTLADGKVLSLEPVIKEVTSLGGSDLNTWLYMLTTSNQQAMLNSPIAHLIAQTNDGTNLVLAADVDPSVLQRHLRCWERGVGRN